MDNFTDYIYFIALCVIPLISALSKKKGKNDESIEPLNDEEQNEVPVQSWEELMEQLKQKTEKTVNPQPIIVNQTNEKTYKEKTQKKTDSQYKIKKNATVVNTPIEVKEPNTENNNVWAFDTTDDTKRAFVYSEIFNRKY